MAQITGTPGNDLLDGTADDDEILGLGGFDWINGLGGNDRLYGGDSGDALDGGEGDDILWGGAGADSLHDIDGGNDQLFGEAGDDYISVSHWGEYVGDLLANGGEGDDEIAAFLAEGTGRADIYGGTGHDRIHSQGGGDATVVAIDAGEGNDFVAVFRGESYRPDYRIALGAGADLLQGAVGSLAGPVTITDFAPGDGGDALVLTGDLLRELVRWTGTENPFAAGYLRLVDNGTDTLLQIDRDRTNGVWDFVTVIVFQNVDAFDLTPRNLSGYAPNGSIPAGQTIVGTPVADTLSGTMSADAMSGGDGNDVLFGAAGDDLIEGGDGGDRLDGDFGDDVVRGEGGDDILDAGPNGNDQLFGGDGRDQLLLSRLIGRFPTSSVMDGGAGPDRLSFTSTVVGHNVEMRGGDDIDDFDVRANDATVEIDAGAGNDRLSIDPGDSNSYDIILGSGSDTVTLYSLDAYTSEFDVAVLDFESGAGGDTIVLTDMLARYVPAWSRSTDPFAAGYLRLVQSGADTVLQINRTGSDLNEAFVSLVKFRNVDRQTFTADNLGGLQPDLSNTAPVLWISSQPRYFLESVMGSTNNSARLSVSLKDADDLHLVSVTFTITGGFHPDQDRLGYSDNLWPGYDEEGIPVGASGDIVALHDDENGELVLISPSGMATMEQWSHAAGGVHYYNLSEEPDSTTRTVTIAASDGEASAVGTADIAVLPRNDGPSGADRTLSLAEDSVYTFAIDHFAFSDLDGDAFAGLQISSAPTGGKIYLDADGPGGNAPVEVLVPPAWLPAPIVSVADITAGKLTFVPTANLAGAAAAIVRFRVVDDGGRANDGWNLDPTTVNLLTFDIAGVNDVPSLAISGGAIVEHSAGGTLAATASATDPDAAPGTLVFSLDDNGGGRFAIEATTGKIKVVAPSAIDFETSSSHRLIVRVTDAHGATATLVTTIAVSNAAEALAGSGAADFLSALSDEDWSITGAGGNDRLEGRAGNDRLDGGVGADKMAGGEGDDVYVVDEVGDEVAEAAGAGTDRIEATVDFALPDAVENLTLAGNARAGTGNGSANRIVGNALDNLLNGGAAADVLEGRAGDDIYVVDHSADNIIELADQGTDTARANASYTLPSEVENLILTGGGNHSITGNILANSLAGNGGNNRLNGGAGADTMAGGLGHDTYVVDNLYDVVVENGSAGNDLVESSVDFRLPTHVEKLVLTGTAGRTARGNTGDNTITGNSGANTINGIGGNDVIDGGAGNDLIYGSTGNDSLKGGLGLDRFLFNSALGSTNVDKILDFSVPNDTISLDRAIFTKAGANGTLAAAAFRQGTAAGDVSDRIVYDQATGKIFYDADGAGGAAQVLFATVTAGTALTSADFVIYS